MAIDRTQTGMIGRWWWTLDVPLFLAVLSLMLAGALMMLAGGPPVAERLGLPSEFFVHRHWVFLGIGAAFVAMLSMIPSRFMIYMALPAFAMCVVGLVVVLFVGDEVKGASRWLNLGFFTLQPSEFVKPLLAVITAYLLALPLRYPAFPAMLSSGVLCGTVVLLLVLQPDIGMVVTVTAVWLCQLFVAGLAWGVVLVLAGLGVAGLMFAYMFLPHVTERIDRFFAPADEAGYQVTKSLEAIQSGGWLGLGLGKGEVSQSLPDAHTDFIVAAGMEEFGVLALLVILALVGVIVLRACYRAYQEQDRFLTLAIAGLALQFGIQSMINIGVTLHLLPTKGMTLPFISYGGSSVLACALGMGMLLSLTRRRYGERRSQEASNELHWLYHQSMKPTGS